MKDNTRKNMRLAAYSLSIAALVAAMLSLSYYTGAELITKVYGCIAAMGHFFVLLWLVLGIPTLACAVLIRSEKIFKGYLMLVLSIAAIALVADIMVYSQYRFHINAAMVDLFFNAGDTISFSRDMWLKIACISLGVIGFSSILVWVVACIVKQRRYSQKITGIFIGSFVVVELVYMVAFATSKLELIAIKNYIPLFQPLTANSLMIKLGVKVQETPMVSAKSSNGLKYPLNEPVFEKNSKEKPKNIIYIMADSLRADMLNEEVMPKTWSWAQNEILLKEHYSSGNATRAGVFGLFYSLPPSYWHAALTTHMPPFFITCLQNKGYDIQAFTTATLASPEFTETVFAKVRPIRLESKGADGVARDLNSIEDFEVYLKKREKERDERPFFAFIFLDSTHGYVHPKGLKRFEPAWDEPDYLKLTNDTDPTPIRNLYKNSAAWTDELFAKTLNIIEKHRLMSNSIVMISSDHGQEMNDSKKNFWSHNSAYNDAQTKIPGIIHWPGKSAYVENNWTISYDIPMTILRHELAMTSKLEDVGIGYDLFEGKLENRKWFLMGGYSNVAIREKDRIIEIDKMGLLQFYDTEYNKHSNTKRSANIAEAFELMSKYRK